jgi:hypothetical protein
VVRISPILRILIYSEPVYSDLRLGDVIDDFCVKCRRLTNHSIVSLVSGAAAKVRCRTCYSDHDYRNEQAPPSKKELAKQKELYNAVLAGASASVPAALEEASPVTEVADEVASGTDERAASAVADGSSGLSADSAPRRAAKKPAKAIRKK